MKTAAPTSPAPASKPVPYGQGEYYTTPSGEQLYREPLKGQLWAPTPEGEARARKRHGWMWPAPKPSGRVPGLPKVVQEAAEEWADRLVRMAEKREGSPNHWNNAHAPYIGRDAGRGYRIRATDGHMAVLEWGKPTKDGDPMMKLRVPEPYFEAAVSPALQAAVGRIASVTGRVNGRLGRMNLGLSGDFQRWTLQTDDIDHPGFEAREVVTVEPHDQDYPSVWECAVGAAYLRAVIGEKTVEGATVRFAPGSRVMEVFSRRLVRGPVVVLATWEWKQIRTGGGQ